MAREVESIYLVYATKNDLVAAFKDREEAWEFFYEIPEVKREGMLTMSIGDPRTFAGNNHRALLEKLEMN